MISDMQLAELDELANAQCEGVLTDQQIARIEELVTCNATLRHDYIIYLQMHACAERGREIVKDGIACQGSVTEGKNHSASSGSALPIVEGFQSLPAVDVPPAAFLHGPVGYLSGWPVAYLIATVVFGIGALISAFTYVSHPVEVARQSSPVTRHLPASESTMQFVGRITGMIDCQWADESTAAINGAHVPLARKYALASGLMKITYDSGAEIILQGPVVYEVESKNGGYLSIGKLTGKVEVETAKGFSVRTPTAIVTDLGTEFAVEVNTLGNTTSHVFRGSVKLEMASAGGGTEGAPRVLHANESAQVEKESGNGRVTIHSIKVDPARFVRSGQLSRVVEERRLKPFRRWQAYREELRKDPSLLVYYDFQQVPGKPDVLRNVAANGSKSLDGTIMNVVWSIGRMAGKHALLFHSRADRVEVDLPQTVDDMTLAVWVQIESLNGPSENESKYSGLLMSSNWGGVGQLHWQIRFDGRIGVVVGNGCNLCQIEPSFDHDRLGQWTHLVIVYDHSVPRAQFYVNGEMVEEMAISTHVPIQIGPAWIGHWNGWESGRNLLGRIDEMIIFNRPLADEEIQNMYETGKPVNTSQKNTRSEASDSEHNVGSKAAWLQNQR